MNDNDPTPDKTGENGNTITIHMNRKSSSFTHKVYLKYGSSDYTIGTGVGDNISFNTSKVASNLYALIPEASVYSNVIRVETYNGSTKIGEKTCAYNAKVTNANPSFSNFTYKDTNSVTTAVTGNDQILIRGQSELAVTISSTNKAVGQKGASVKSYTASISGLSKAANYSASDVTISVFGTSFAAGTQTLSVKAVDGRGNSTTVSKSVTVLDYSDPVVATTATRKNNLETETTLHIEGTISMLDDLNAVTEVKYRYKKQSTSTWGSWNQKTDWTLATNGKITPADTTLSLDNSESYDIEVAITDKIKIVTAAIIVSVGVPIFRIGTDGNVYNNEKRLVPYDEIVKYTTHVGQIIMTTKLTTAAQVANIYGGTWVAWGAGRVPVGIGSNGTTNYSTVEATGGEEKHTLTIAKMPSHTHTQNSHKHKTYDRWNSYGAGNLSSYGYISPANGSAQDGKQQDYTNSVTATNQNTGGGGAHNNLQPYITVYMWKRTA